MAESSERKAQRKAQREAQRKAQREAPGEIVVSPHPGALGAEILGIDLGGEQVSDEAIAQIRAALVQHHVVFFRDQTLSPEQQVAFGARFGELEDYPFVAPLPGHPKLIPVIKEPDERTNFGGGWHSDLAYAHRPPMATMLYALEVPERGGDTLFADGIAAYEALSPAMQEMLHPLKVEYDVKNVMPRYPSEDTGTARGNRSMQATSDQAIVDATPCHPLVRTHPESGKKGIYLSRGHTIRFQGMTPAESRPLLDWIGEHLTQPVFTTRFHWGVGSIAFWDNRCVAHYALNDYHGERRHMHRLTIAGDEPF